MLIKSFVKTVLLFLLLSISFNSYGAEQNGRQDKKASKTVVSKKKERSNTTKVSPRWVYVMDDSVDEVQSKLQPKESGALNILKLFLWLAMFFGVVLAIKLLMAVLMIVVNIFYKLKFLE